MSEFDIAIVGMAGRFPGAPDVATYWQNLCDGVESITFFSEDELRAAGIPDDVIRDENYVPAAPILDDVAGFDHRYFGYSPREAETMDPQHRLFLETCVTALEHAGCDPQRTDGRVGVFGGSAMNTYLLFTGLLPQFSNDYLPTLIGNDKDFLTTRVAFKLDLNGPAMSVQTACSTSLVAVHLACQSLLNNETDVALAGGVSVRVPHIAGHKHIEGSVFTPDGHCRTFDSNAAGTIFGSGVGVVTLKRLTDAVDAGDTIHAVVKGSAVNNDGSSKVDYTAPSVTTQSEVIAEALAASDVTADTIGYVEAHGTGTYLGDPIEVTALTRAFREDTDEVAFCTIGSVKPNIGHLDAAAGIAGLIKTALAVREGLVPPTINLTEPNPEIDFASSPFVVRTTKHDWSETDGPRRAGISSLGIGGTNAHVILEQPPTSATPDTSSRPQLHVASAKTPTALQTLTDRIGDAIAVSADPEGLAATLQLGRAQHSHRSYSVGRSSFSRPVGAGEPIVVQMFSGQGSQYVHMGRGLYEAEPAFTQVVDECAEILGSELGLDLRNLLYPTGDERTAESSLRDTRYTQPALFTVELALASLWKHWGVTADAFVGHSIGEYVAAHLAGVFELKDALRLVAARGAMMHAVEPGSMLAVPIAATELDLPPEVTLAAINSPDTSVVAGPTASIETFANELRESGITPQPLHTSHAFHSPMMDPVVDEFERVVRGVDLSPPSTPFTSNVTGSWITPGEATDPAYWARHLRQPVRFADCIMTVVGEHEAVLIEVGPGRTLATLAQGSTAMTTVGTTRHPSDEADDLTVALGALGAVWATGVEVDWSALHPNGSRRIPAPTYPFERTDHWYRGTPSAEATRGTIPAERSVATHPSRWLYRQIWQSIADDAARPVGSDRWLVVGDADLEDALNDAGALLVSEDPSRLVCRADFARLLELVQAWGDQPVHLDVVADPTDANEVMVAGLVAVIGQERPHITCRMIEARSVDVALAEIVRPPDHSHVALRDDRRWVPAFEPIPFVLDVPTPWREGGTYLITGGLGELGRAIGLHLAETAGAKLVLTTRGAPDDERAGETIAAVEAAGGQATVVQADASDRTAMARAVEVAEGMCGVIHAAGVIEDARSGLLLGLDERAVSRQMDAKVRGIEVLHDLTAEIDLDVAVAMSSLSTVLGGLGYGAYAAANTYLDEFARRHPERWTAIRWDAWGNRGIDTTAGLEILDRIVANHAGEPVLVSTTDLAERWERWRRPNAKLGAATATAAAVATGSTEEFLAAVWHELLGVTDVGVDESFFDLGGTSLLALTLFARIEQRYGQMLELATLFEAPTIAALADVIGPADREAQPPIKNLVGVRPTGSRPPLFVVHAHLGNVLFLEPLARLLHADQPLFGIQATGLDGLADPVGDLVVMAEHYGAQVSEAQPSGPILLGGYCMGGVVAFEMAQILRRAGREIALLALIDASTPAYAHPATGEKRFDAATHRVRVRANHELANLVDRDLADGVRYLGAKGKRISARVRSRLEAIGVIDSDRANATRAQIEVTDRIREVHTAAFDAYEPSEYPGDAVLFRATRQPWQQSPDRTMGWGSLIAGTLHIHDVPGNNEGLFEPVVEEPGVSVLARELTRYLA